jgi:hypothetical protein
MKNELYITGLGMISAQESLGVKNTKAFTAKEDFHCIEPDYKAYIPPAKARRMSRILKYSYVAAKQALTEAALEQPQTINVATALGCLKDTTLFVQDMIESKEQVLKPTPFINSTHNTVAGLLALTYGAKGQNFTFSHTDFSFEHALLDVMMRMEEGEIENALLGAVEELTEETELIKRHLHMENQGEGASFFAVSGTGGSDYYARVKAVAFAYELEGEDDLYYAVMDFLKSAGADAAQVNTVVSDHDLTHVFDIEKQILYKEYCGDYMTASGFGFGMAALEVFNRQQDVLLINHNNKNSYSLVLLGR